MLPGFVPGANLLSDAITSLVDVQDDGLKAIANLEEALKACDKVVESSDKQAIPSVQQNALTYVGQIEEAMMKGFPFEVPSQYDSLPQLKASSCPLRVTTLLHMQRSLLSEE